MSAYADTSFLVPLYVTESRSRESERAIERQAPPLIYTAFHDLEFRNAIWLKVFRGEMDATAANAVLLQVEDDLQSGFLHAPLFVWDRVFARARDLSMLHTPRLGLRALDILQVAIALEVNAKRFLTFDVRQRNLAEAAGLRA